ncbi:hypothetical protein [Brevundimonas sp.]
MLKIALPALAALGLVAFAAQTMATDAEQTSQPVDGMGWHVNHDGDETRLFYGVANSDQLAVMMSCHMGDGEIVTLGAVQPVSARSAGSVEADIDPLSGELIETRALSAHDPAMVRLARSGRLGVQDETARFDLSATPQERQAIRRFLDDCGTSQA